MSLSDQTRPQTRQRAVPRYRHGRDRLDRNARRGPPGDQHVTVRPRHRVLATITGYRACPIPLAVRRLLIRVLGVSAIRRSGLREAEIGNVRLPPAVSPTAATALFGYADGTGEVVSAIGPFHAVN